MDAKKEKIYGRFAGEKAWGEMTTLLGSHIFRASIPT
jgi:hypothetical protein